MTGNTFHEGGDHRAGRPRRGFGRIARWSYGSTCAGTRVVGRAESRGGVTGRDGMRVRRNAESTSRGTALQADPTSTRLQETPRGARVHCRPSRVAQATTAACRKRESEARTVASEGVRRHRPAAARQVGGPGGRGYRPDGPASNPNASWVPRGGVGGFAPSRDGGRRGASPSTRHAFGAASDSGARVK